jgi:hypothetical protein
VRRADVETGVALEDIGDGKLRETTTKKHRGKSFSMTKIFSKNEPSWQEKRWADDDDSACVFDMLLSPECDCGYAELNKAHRAVGEAYLLEVWLGLPFFDFVADAMGFEKAIFYFMESDNTALEALRERYTRSQKKVVDMLCDHTPYESYVIGCSYSCNSLLGPNLWRVWDKPYITAMAEALHRKGKLLHIHFHGKSIEAAGDFPDTGVDCVCPFERPKGGDVDGIDGLKKVRAMLRDKVTFNGNVHTVDTLINGAPADVRREVNEIKEAFEGSRRYIIGSGDQVGYETPEENLVAMVEEGKV